MWNAAALLRNEACKENRIVMFKALQPVMFLLRPTDQIYNGHRVKRIACQEVLWPGDQTQS